MGNQNRKISRDELAHARSVIRAAFPDQEPVFGGHGDQGGHRAPRDHTLAFRLRDGDGQFRSNLIWLMPDELATLTVDAVRAKVRKSNGRG